MFDKFRKKAEEQKLKENNEKLWKPPEPTVDEPVPYISFENLRPLPNPEEFIKKFPDLIDGKR